MRRREPRNECEKHGRGHREAGADPEDARIDCDLEGADREAGGKPGEERDERVREQHPENGAGSAQHEALRQQRASQRAVARAERCAHGQLALAANRASQDQIRNVRARDEEHDAGGGE